MIAMLRRLIAPIDRLTRTPSPIEEDDWVRDMKRREAESIAAEQRLREDNPLVRSMFGMDRHSDRRPT